MIFQNEHCVLEYKGRDTHKKNPFSALHSLSSLPAPHPLADQLVIFLMTLLYIYGNSKCTSNKCHLKINSLLFSFCLPLVSIHSKITTLWLKGKCFLLLIIPTSPVLSSAVFLLLFFPFLPLILCLLQQKELRWGDCRGTFCFYSSVIQPS